MHWASLMAAQRQTSIRVAAGYCTTSELAAGLLSGTPLLDLIAEGHARTYRWCKELRRNRWVEDWSPKEIKRRNMDTIYDSWEERLLVKEYDTTSVTLRKAFQGKIKQWCERKHGQLNYWNTQILTGHGSFGVYLARVRKEETSLCRYCKMEEDTAEHTLARCPEWADARCGLTETAGCEVDAANIIEVMLSSKDKWKAVTIFAEDVLRIKAQDESEEERKRKSSPTQKRRRRRDEEV